MTTATGLENNSNAAPKGQNGDESSSSDESKKEDRKKEDQGANNSKAKGGFKDISEEELDELFEHSKLLEEMIK